MELLKKIYLAATRQDKNAPCSKGPGQEMASVGGTVSLLAASDELFNYVCEPCKTEGNLKEARQYCEDCREYLCDLCVNYHTKLTLTKNHKIMAADSVLVGMSRHLTFFCACNKNQEIKCFCEDHADVICSPCKTFKHHQCQTISIQRKCSGHTASKMESIVNRAKSLKDKFEQLKEECRTNETELKRSKEACKNEIKSFRKQLAEFLDKLERDMLAELDQLEVKESQQIERQITILTTALKMLDADCQLLNDAINDGRKESMFVADLRTSKVLYGYEKRLIEFEKEIKHISLSFEKNKKLDDLRREIKIFGSLTASPTVAMQRETTVLLGRQIQSRREVNVRLADDKKDPWISGCEVMPNGSVVICDNMNEKIKLLDNTLSLTQSLELTNPWNVSVLDTNTVIVTSLLQQKLRFIQVFPTLKLGRVIQLDKRCWGVHVAADAVYVTCYDFIGGEVRVFDKQGNFIRLLDDSLLQPYYITGNTAGNKVFVSDYKSDTITCITADGSAIYQYKDTNLEKPLGVYCDDEDNVLVCGRDSNTVQLITADGTNGGTLLSAADGLKLPYSITFRNSDNTLVVGCYGLGYILVYTLAK